MADAAARLAAAERVAVLGTRGALYLLETVRGLRLAHPELAKNQKLLLAKLRERRPDLALGNKEVREALAALKAEAEESKAPEAGRTRSSMSPVAAAVQPADQPPPPQPALEPPGAVASVVEEPCMLSSLPADLLALVAKNLVPQEPNASRLLAQSLARFAAASTMCLAAAQDELRAAWDALVVDADELATAFYVRWWGSLERFVVALREHAAVAPVVQLAFSALTQTASESDDEDIQQAVEAGAFEAVAEAMLAHPQAGRQAWDLQYDGCFALHALCRGFTMTQSEDDAAVSPDSNPGPSHSPAALARSQRAAEAGVLEAVVAAMRAHPVGYPIKGLERNAEDADGMKDFDGFFWALRMVCRGNDAAAAARRQRAAEAGVLEVVLETMRRAMVEFAPSAYAWGVVQYQGCCTLRMVCYGDDAGAAARRQRAVEAGALDVVVEAMRRNMAEKHYREHPDEQGCWVLHNLCYGDDAAAPARRQRAVEAGAREVMAAALLAHPNLASWGISSELR